jgi:RNA 2',3'-cyclic 3'-phosphodiesterase
MRLFIGIPLANATAHELAGVVNQLRSQTTEYADALRWAAPESWHITLQFLGSTAPQQYECIRNCLGERRHPAFEIQLGALDTFDRAGVLFVDVCVTPQLLALQQSVTAATAPCGFTPEDRPYHPHITLARRKGRIGGRELRDMKLQIQPPKLPSFTAETLILYESIPTPGGSRYEIRDQFPFGAG